MSQKNARVLGSFLKPFADVVPNFKSGDSWIPIKQLTKIIQPYL